MSSNPDKKSARVRRDNKPNERAEVRYFKGEEQFERWRKEFVQHQDYELKLAAVSKVTYSPVDFESLLVTEPFPELKLTDYSYLVDKAASNMEGKYVYPVAARIAAIVCLVGVLAILFSPMTLLITAAFGVAVAVSLHFTIKDREEAIKKAKLEAMEEIGGRNAQERLAYEEARRQYEEKEESRITLINQLMAGEAAAVRSRVDEVLNQVKLPVVVEVEIDFYRNIPLAKVYLPTKGVIPKQLCEILPTGRLQYQDKDTRVFNKQYFELSAAIILQIASTILAHIPSFQEVYAAGIVKNEFSDDCVIAVKIHRDKIDCINRAANAIAAIQAFDAVYECDTSLALYPIDMLYPPEWEGVDKQQLKSLKVRIFK
ncbi:hypothetical protein [Sporomusa sp. GT1]|uniref:hypothetical protein n=1 Tax=Sporomusa sp. GT1 TaxID=1534747 RepID=UPI001665FAEB|nr:hypothetical protein [Sporomusa sp. GT1]